MSSSMTDEWMQQFYHQQQQQQPHLMDAMVPTMDGFSDATVVTTNSSSNTIGQLNPKANNNAFKPPLRRRSRASKKTPTTLLNANTTNFRELVQQFTGCSSTNSASSSMSFSLLHKGPITLNFQQGSTQKEIQHSTNSGTIMPQFGTTTIRSSYNYNQVPWQKQLPAEQVPMMQSGSVPISYVSSSTRTNNSMDVSDGFVMVNDFGLHELTANAFSNDIKNHDGYFM